MITDITKPTRLTKSLLLKNANIYVECTDFKKAYTPNVTVAGLYTHDITEISLISSGNGVHRVLNQAIPCTVGDIYITDANIPHGFFAADAEEKLTVCRIWFDPADWFDGDIASRESERFCHGVFSDGALTSYAMLTEKAQSEIHGYIESIQHEISAKESEWEDAVRSYLAILLITVSRYVGNTIKNIPTAKPKEWGPVSTAILAVNESFGDNSFTLEAIADSLYISQSHLSRLFKRFTGETFTEYLKNVRLTHACRLLRDTDLTVDEIAGQCGLRDIPSFYRAFNAYKGMTPSQYRNKKTNQNKNLNEREKLIMSILNEISANLQIGKAKIVKELVQRALDEGVEVEKILNEGLLAGMSIIGEKFKNNEVYVPEVLVAARAMNMGTQILKPHLAANGIVAKGKVCIGTVQGDLHDIGKNLVKMMLEGKGLEVIDLGTDVAPETFVNTAIEQGCQVICCSALLTTTMGVMEDVVKLAAEKGIRDTVKIMVGGAPVNEDYCKKIGADVYTSDAASAADEAVKICEALLA